MTTGADVNARGWLRQASSPILDGNWPLSPRPSGSTSEFFGYEHIALSAITVGAIDMATTNNSAPKAVMASASNVLTTGIRSKSSLSVVPYQDLEFRWTVTKNDDSPVEDLEGIVDPRDNSAANPYTDQIGPEFTCLLREPGTYKLTLTARGMSVSTGTVIEQTRTETITVLENTDPKTWIDGVGGDDANDGLDPWGFALSTASYTESTRELTQVGAFTSYVHDVSGIYTSRDNWIYIDLPGFEGLYEIESKSNNDTIVLVEGLGSDQTNVTSSDGPKQTFNGSITDGIQYMIKGGQTYVLSSEMLCVGSGSAPDPISVSGYGGKPTFNPDGLIGRFIDMTSGTSEYVSSEVRFTGIDFDMNVQCSLLGGSNQSTVDMGTSTFLLDTCDTANSNFAIGVLCQFKDDKDVTMNFCLYGDTIDNMGVSSTIGVFTNNGNNAWQRIFGTIIDNNHQNTSTNHYVYFDGYLDHVHVGYSYTRDGDDGNFALNFDSNQSPSQYVCVNNNLFGNNSKWGMDFSNQTNSSNAEQFEHVVVLNNKANCKNGMLFNYTLFQGRAAYNQGYGSTDPARGFFNQNEGTGYVPTNFYAVIDRNQVYGQKLIKDDESGNREVVDNVAYQSANDEVFEYNEANIGLNSLTYAADGNNLYAPNKVGGTIIDNGAGQVTLATFNSDRSGVNTSSDPGWPDPANGDFGGIPVGITVNLP